MPRDGKKWRRGEEQDTTSQKQNQVLRIENATSEKLDFFEKHMFFTCYFLKQRYFWEAKNIFSKISRKTLYFEFFLQFCGVVSGIWYGSVPKILSNSIPWGCRSVPRFFPTQFFEARNRQIGSTWAHNLWEMQVWCIRHSATPPWISQGFLIPSRRSCGRTGQRGRRWSEDRWCRWERSCGSVLWQVRQHVGHDAGMTNCFRDTTMRNPGLCALEPRVFAWWVSCPCALRAVMHCACTNVSCEWLFCLHLPSVVGKFYLPANRNWS